MSTEMLRVPDNRKEGRKGYHDLGLTGGVMGVRRVNYRAMLVEAGVLKPRSVYPAHKAAASGRVKKLQKLHSKGLFGRAPRCPDACFLNDEGDAPIHTAARNSQASSVEALVLVGASVDQKSFHTGDTALHIACRNGDLSSVRALLRCKASLDVTNKRGQNPLHTAASTGSWPVVSALLEDYPAAMSSASVARDKDGRTPAQAAQLFGHQIVVDLLNMAVKEAVESTLGSYPAAIITEMAA